MADKQFIRGPIDMVNWKEKMAACGLVASFCDSLGRIYSGAEDAGRAGIRTSEIVIAYDPVWEIGTGKVATPAHAQEFGTSCYTFNFFTSAL
nr:triose-phosphate isomerase [Ipomoea batatas]